MLIYVCSTLLVISLFFTLLSGGPGWILLYVGVIVLYQLCRLIVKMIPAFYDNLKRTNRIGIAKKVLAVVVFIIMCSAAYNAFGAYRASQSLIKLTQNSYANQYFASNESFAWSLFKEIDKSNPKQNNVISPVGVSRLLSITLNGSTGQTQQEIAGVVNVTPQDIGNINEINRIYDGSIDHFDPKVSVDISSALFHNDRVSPTGSFLDICHEDYRCDVNNSLSPLQFNSWINTMTRGAIPDSFASDLGNTDLALTSIVYFNGKWSIPFHPNDTQTSTFHLDNRSELSVDMMHLKEESFKGIWETNFKAVRLPYGHGRMAMYIFLPDAVDGLPDFIQSLDKNKIDGYINQMSMSEMDIYLPRFQLKTSCDLNDPLSKLGMKKAFEFSNDFAPIENKLPLRINKIKQMTLLQVNEQGTVAVSTTNMFGATAGAKLLSRIYVDHPFLCIIRDDATGNILFMGAIRNPAENSH